ncbi:replication factor A protein 3 [Mollisia scopiformis]|uniref:Replication factor A protein 3 n=1 Tax=Mollisia scopiformis TaxID=149040 RepID=A0A194XPK8_MOLSC|nr:replication factor A protein 3 [Mollisia scopiformis]KUJ22009.1 replication factor A protein 3 [Mollisia scopiformis]
MAEPTLSTPRITSQYLDTFISRTIRLIGKVTQLRGETATIDSEGNVTALLNRDAHLTVGNAVEVVGKVNQDLSVKVLRATDLGRDVDYTAISAVVDATHRYKEIFYAE